MASKFLISVDAIGEEAFIDSLNLAKADVKRAVIRAAERTKSLVHESFLLLLQNAMNKAGIEAFPIPYRIHLLTVAGTIFPSVGLHYYGYDLAYDLSRLGDYNDLAQGFHYHAQLRRGGQVELPWTSRSFDSSLKNPFDVRYDYWWALRNGIQVNGKQITGNEWSETLNARIAVWGDKAPEWLLLQYGQRDEPSNEPYPIIEVLQRNTKKIGTGILAQELYNSYQNLFGRRANLGADRLGEHAIFNEAASSDNLSAKGVGLGRWYSQYMLASIRGDVSGFETFMNEMRGLENVEYSVLEELFKRGLKE